MFPSRFGFIPHNSWGSCSRLSPSAKGVPTGMVYTTPNLLGLWEARDDLLPLSAPVDGRYLVSKSGSPTELTKAPQIIRNRG